MEAKTIHLAQNGNNYSCSYNLVSSPEDLPAVQEALSDSHTVYIDLETTGLDPRNDRIRLMTLGTQRGIFIIDCFAVNPVGIWGYLEEKTLAGHNLIFDLSILRQYGYIHRGEVIDTVILCRLLTAGTKEANNLKAICTRYLGVDLDKSERASDWAGDLTGAQLFYAALDVFYLEELVAIIQKEIDQADLRDVATVELDAFHAVVEMTSNGVPIDRDGWLALAQVNKSALEKVSQELDETAPSMPGKLFDCWNWSSPAQVKDMFHLLGIPVEKTDDETLASIDHPMAKLLREHRGISKLVTAYGGVWLQENEQSGRIYPRWNQMGAESGRMSCNSPNLQQIPRTKEYRECFRAGPGNVLVKADYSQIELRLAAKISGDDAMIKAYKEGRDLHRETAVAVLGKPAEQVSKEDRQLAKALNFGLVYGMGARSFKEYAQTNYDVAISLEQAESMRRRFFERYQGLARWHSKYSGQETIETRTILGRRRIQVSRFSEKLNTPVQGSGADGLKIALAQLWKRHAEFPEGKLILAVHDELVLECPSDRAEFAKLFLTSVMKGAMEFMLQPIPCEVEVTIGNTWGG